jgi:hypothetical protein
MVTAKDINSVLVNALGIPESEMKQRSLLIRGAGYLPTRGRGRNAPHLDLEDISNLITSAMTRVEYPATQVVQGMVEINKLVCEDEQLNFSPVDGVNLNLKCSFPTAIARILEYFYHVIMHPSLVLENHKNLPQEDKVRLICNLLCNQFPIFGYGFYKSKRIAWITINDFKFETSNFVHDADVFYKTFNKPLGNKTVTIFERPADEQPIDEFLNSSKTVFIIETKDLLPQLFDAFIFEWTKA